MFTKKFINSGCLVSSSDKAIILPNVTQAYFFMKCTEFGPTQCKNVAYSKNNSMSCWIHTEDCKYTKVNGYDIYDVNFSALGKEENEKVQVSQ